MHKEFRSRWVIAGYGSVMGSAEVVPPPPSDFIRLYHLVSARHGLENIERGRLKVSRFQDLNDPFELLAVNFKEKPIRAMVRDFKASYHTQTGLLCFSANWTNPVLWSNYSDKHRGICLGFDLPRNRVQQVEYADERILPELADDARPLELSEAQKMCCCEPSFAIGSTNPSIGYSCRWRMQSPMAPCIFVRSVRIFN